MPSPGEWLRKLREELHLTNTEVDRLTAEIARGKSNRKYWIGRNRLRTIEGGKTVPNIFEVDSLAECYRVTFRAVLDAFGIKLGDLSDVRKSSLESAGIAEHPLVFETQELRFGFPFLSQISFEETRLLTETAEELGVPAAVLPRLNGGRYRFGVIGLNDYTMGELVPPGSVVVIDTEQCTVAMSEYKSVRERPIYFVWHDKGYSCSWCYQEGDTLMLVPYPTSRQPVMTLKMPRGATITGRVIHVWSPVVPTEDSTRLG